MDSRCRGDSLLLVCRTKAVICRRGNNYLGADVPITAPQHLMAFYLFFLRTSPMGARCCYPYFTNEQWRQEVLPAWLGCFPSLPPWPLWCRSAVGWLVWCPTTARKRARGWGGLRTWPDGHGSSQRSWSIQPTFGDLAGLRFFLGVEPPCTAGRSLGPSSGRRESCSAWSELWLCPDLHQFLPFFTLVWFSKTFLVDGAPLFVWVSAVAHHLPASWGAVGHTNPWGCTGESSGDIVFWWIW